MKRQILGPFAVLSLLVATSATAQGIKWHPGHYVRLTAGNTLSQHLSQIREIGGVSSIKGVQVPIYWHKLETSKGVYDFSRIDRYIRVLKAQPTKKRLVVRVMDRKFNTTSKWGIVPNYLRNNPIYNGGLVRTRRGYAARLWEKPVMDRMIALYKAIGRRYDGNAYFEGIHTEETTLSLAVFPWSYSNAKLRQQWTRLANAVRPAMPHTHLFLNTNYLGTVEQMKKLIQSLVAPSVSTGSSNIFPHSMNQGQRVWTGKYGADYRWTLPISNNVEDVELGGRKGDYTPKQLNDFAYYKLHVNYLFWTRNTWVGDASQRWSTGILPFLRKSPPIRTRCPSSIGTCLRN